MFEDDEDGVYILLLIRRSYSSFCCSGARHPPLSSIRFLLLSRHRITTHQSAATPPNVDVPQQGRRVAAPSTDEPESSSNNSWDRTITWRRRMSNFPEQGDFIARQKQASAQAVQESQQQNSRRRIVPAAAATVRAIMMPITMMPHKQPNSNTCSTSGASLTPWRKPLPRAPPFRTSWCPSTSNWRSGSSHCTHQQGG